MGCSAAAFGLARVPASACAIIECPGRTKSPISPVLVLMDRAHRDLSFDTWIDCLAVPGFTPVGPEFQWFWKINWSSPRAPGRSHQVGWHVIGKSSSRSTRICNKKITFSLNGRWKRRRVCKIGEHSRERGWKWPYAKQNDTSRSSVPYIAVT